MKVLLFRLFLLSAVGLLGLAGYLALREPGGPEPPLTVEEPERNLGELAIGTHELVFRITNQADQPRRIVGLAEG